MWTAFLDSQYVDLRRLAAADRVAMHEDRSIDWRCRGCKGRAHMRRHPDAIASNFEAFEDGMAPFITIAHHPGEAEICRAMGFHTDESTAHATLKAMLARAASAAGWDVDIEVPGDGCQADVVATKDGKSQVLEAQLAALHRADAITRDDRYTKAFGPATWIHTKQRDWRMRIPSLRIDNDNHGLVIRGIKVDGGERNAEPRLLHDVVAQRLDGRLEWIFDREFGFFRDKATAPTRRPRTPTITTKRGGYVQECVRPPVFSTPVDTIPKSLNTDTWTPERWAGAKRMAESRQATGGVLTALDREALQR